MLSYVSWYSAPSEPVAGFRSVSSEIAITAPSSIVGMFEIPIWNEIVFAVGSFVTVTVLMSAEAGSSPDESV